MALTILMIEDCEDDQKIFQRALRGTGSRLVPACSAREGLALAAEVHPDLILLDFNLPDMDGLDFLDKFTDRGVASVPIIMLTGEGNEAIAVAAMKSGASDYLVKDLAGDYLRLLPTVIRRTCAAHEGKMRARRMSDLSEAILHTVADGIMGVNADGRILFANPAAERMLLCDASHICGRHITEFLRQADHREDWSDHPLTAAHRAATVCRDCDVLQRASGASFPASYTASPLDFEGNGRLGWVIVFQDITQRKHEEEELVKTAQYDSLTGIPNRLMFQDFFAKSLKRLARKSQRLALFFLDLDNFKAVNDSHGHLMGDQVLQMVAQRLVKCVREGDLVSRFGGDEFTLLIEDCEPAQLGEFAHRIIAEMELPLVLGCVSAHLSASIGIAVYPECGSDEHTLLQKADAAMYRVKKEGKHGFAFSPELASLL
jgi:diguanylate cyclase (GGDEF)-like protein/PAS domain S-box-containing protein